MMKAFALGLLIFLCFIGQGQPPELHTLTAKGGSNDVGVLIRFDAASNTITPLHSFNSATGSGPAGVLLQALDGKLYGLISRGGTSDKGVIFSYLPSSDTYQKLHDFNGTNGA
jgi:uncharacterized repeat protein (TIGR03803 family)